MERVAGVVGGRLNRDSNRMGLAASHFRSGDSRRTSGVVMFARCHSALRVVRRGLRDRKVGSTGFCNRTSGSNRGNLARGRRGTVVGSFGVNRCSMLVSADITRRNVSVPTISLIMLCRPIPSRIHVVREHKEANHGEANHMGMLVAGKAESRTCC